METYLNQILVGRACIAIAKAMSAYASTGAENYEEVGKILRGAMGIISNELTPENSEKFSIWLLNHLKEES